MIDPIPIILALEDDFHQIGEASHKRMDGEQGLEGLLITIIHAFMIQMIIRMTTLHYYKYDPHRFRGYCTNI